MVRLPRSLSTALRALGLIGLVLLVLLMADSPMSPPSAPDSQADDGLLARAAAGEPAGERPEEEPFARRRRWMVEHDLAGRDIKNKKVLAAMGRVRRQEFVPPRLQRSAYADYPLPIGHEQTISQPYIVALMTQLVEPGAESRALDVGTGSGYQAAVLAEICKEVYGIEIVKPLADEAKKRLAALGYKNVTVRHGDGYRGWKDKAPFDVIVVAAAPAHVPQPLVDQLAPGGKMVIPVGRYSQQLVVIERDKEGNVHRRPGLPVRFVPMTGEAQRRRE